MAKSQSLPSFIAFLHIFPNLRLTLSTGTLEWINKLKMCCPVGFSEEFIEFVLKVPPIDTGNDQKPKISQVSKILCNIC